MTNILQADLDAMALLRPQLLELAGQVRSGVADHISADGVISKGASPALAAAELMSTATIPTVRLTVAERFGKIADLCETTRTQLLASQSSISLDAAWNRMPTLKPSKR